MKYRRLGNSDIEVSVVCLGTMTYGEQNTEKEAHEQLDYALTQDINFIDTAEMYAVPGRKETQGLTEKFIGTWINKRKNRDRFILATKVTGPGPGLDYISNNLGFSRPRIMEAIEGSFRRLQTDYIDLYQMHWPERKTNYFGKRGYDQHDQKWEDNFAEAISTMQDLIKEGKIRTYGLSNETPWGLHRILALCEKNNWIKPVSIQNPYSLVNRLYEIGMSEMSARENIGLLAYSPLAMGLLSGKYHEGWDKPTDRLNQFKQFSRYNNKTSYKATQKYLELAKQNNLSLTQMALAFVNQQFFVTSNIIGATTMDQLKENIESIKVYLNNDLIKKIGRIHEEIPNPAP